MPLGGGKGLGLGGIVILIIIGLVMGKNPLEMLALVGEMGGQGAAPQSAGVPATSDDPAVDFVRAILGETEDTWTALYAERNQRYQPPRLVLFSNGVNSACGFASAAVGPFYCPGDRQVYLDLGFFHELATRFGAAGDFAQAYVIAHEVGHHIQTLSGVSARVQSARQRGEQVEGANGLLVRQELQADCLAGVWAHHGQQRHNWLEPGDLEEALNAASAIGDDTLQRKVQGRVMPDSFSHGTSAQRVRWFRTGFDSGQPETCDTFAAASL